MKIGFIGQGFIGKNMADDFEDRGFKVVRYDIEKYRKNRDKIKDCDITFIAVPTPTTPESFDDSIVDGVLQLIGDGKIAVIKSTVLPGTTQRLQNKHKRIIIMHSPEFLREDFAREDTRHPERNIVGITSLTHVKQAEIVLGVLPTSPMTVITEVKNAEFVKYIGNNLLYVKTVFTNMCFDLVMTLGGDWEAIKTMVQGDSRIGKSHMSPWDKKGRGAGGHCFIKDFEAFRRLYNSQVGDEEGQVALRGFVNKNNQMLVDSKKDLDLLEGVYGKK